MALVRKLRCLLLICIGIAVLLLLVYFLETQSVISLLCQYSAISVVRSTERYNNTNTTLLKTLTTNTFTMPGKAYSPSSESQRKGHDIYKVKWYRPSSSQSVQAISGHKLNETAKIKQEEIVNRNGVQADLYINTYANRKGQKALAWKGNSNGHEAKYLLEKYLKRREPSSTSLSQVDNVLGFQTSKKSKNEFVSLRRQEKYRINSKLSHEIPVMADLKTQAKSFPNAMTNQSIPSINAKFSDTLVYVNSSTELTPSGVNQLTHQSHHSSPSQSMLFTNLKNSSSHSHFSYQSNNAISPSKATAYHKLSKSSSQSVLPLSKHHQNYSNQSLYQSMFNFHSHGVKGVKGKGKVSTSNLENNDNFTSSQVDNVKCNSDFHSCSEDQSLHHTNNTINIQLKHRPNDFESKVSVKPVSKNKSIKSAFANILFNIDDEKGKQNQTASHNESEMDTYYQVDTSKVDNLTFSEFLDTRSLVDFSRELYVKAENIIQSHQCSSQQLTRLLPVGIQTDYKNSVYKRLVLCGHANMSQEPLIVMATSIYHDNKKQFIFENTIRNWPKMSPHMLPVLYLSDREVVQKSGTLINQACKLGWTVAFVPQCNRYKSPMFRSILDHSMLMWPESEWHGFCNGDILLRQDLLDTVRFLAKDDLNPVMMVSRRRNAYVSSGQVVKEWRDIERLQMESELHPITGVDLFIIRSSQFPIHKVPPLVIGRPGYDNWLVYFTTVHAIQIVDITETITCVHQALSGSDDEDNEYHMDTEYNFQYVSQSMLKRGFIDCIVYYTHHITPLYAKSLYDGKVLSNIGGLLTDSRNPLGNNRESFSDDRGLSRDSRESVNEHMGLLSRETGSLSDNGETLNTHRETSNDKSEPLSDRELHVAMRLPDSFCVAPDPSQLRRHERGMFLNQNLLPWWKKNATAPKKKEQRVSMVVASAVCIFTLILLGALSSLCLFPD